ncbi:MAG: N-acetyltransferase [Flavobacterium sp.]|uniref:GNAT family N-acetyltransferase n=1 Tax=Flavobacterium sp. TaxID=239 RepID=UPI00121BE777|nr:GNAT family N-acetyltransferase [Flavobacterium sp.]RZJ66797.1 MAG: N-acetyltransferase [Flavobacterium sp.]
MEISNEIIPVEAYRELRVGSGLSPKSLHAAQIGLKNSLHSVQIIHEGQTIGIGRIVGDGGCFCQIVDICVLPGFQGRGIGRMIMQDLMKFVDEQLPESCYISLLADGDADKLYSKFGFRDAMPMSKGMFLKK